MAPVVVKPGTCPFGAKGQQVPPPPGVGGKGSRKGPGGKEHIEAHDNLYVWQLPTDCDEQFLRELFQQIGNVISIKCVTDKRYGFVKFASVEEASTAIEEIDGLECYDTTLRVKYADMAPGKGKEKGFGAPSHVSPPAPQVVLPPATLHQTAHVVAPPPPAVVSRAPVAPHPQYAVPRTRIFAQDLPSELSSEAIRSMFENYCSSVECEILTRTATDSVAMMSVPTFDEAQWIVENLNGNIPHGINKPIRVCVAWPSEFPPRKVPPVSYGKAPARVPALHGYSPYHGGKGGAQVSYGASYGASHGGKGGGKDPPIDNVYVFQLPPDFNEARLSDLFADCGSIISVKCVPDKKYGFVRFASVEEAQHAIDTVNGALVDGSPIGVQFARSKTM